jgi:dephospho-CoA kinase
MKLLKRPFLIAVTGGIASGKTIVCKELEKNGFPVYYSDQLTHTILEDEYIKLVILENFGDNLLDGSGKISRKILGDIVFNSSKKLEILNSIIHPEVRKKIQYIIDNEKEDYLIFEIPLLVENKLLRAFDLTINIHCNKDVQIDRLMKYRKMSRNKAEQIINSQIDAEIRKEKTDLTIINNGSLKEFSTSIESLIEGLSEFSFKSIVRIIDIEEN